MAMFMTLHVIQQRYVAQQYFCNDDPIPVMIMREACGASDRSDRSLFVLNWNADADYA